MEEGRGSQAAVFLSSEIANSTCVCCSLSLPPPPRSLFPVWSSRGCGVAVCLGATAAGQRIPHMGQASLAEKSLAKKGGDGDACLQEKEWGAKCCWERGAVGEGQERERVLGASEAPMLLGGLYDFLPPQGASHAPALSAVILTTSSAETPMSKIHHRSGLSNTRPPNASQCHPFLASFTSVSLLFWCGPFFSAECLWCCLRRGLRYGSQTLRCLQRCWPDSLRTRRLRVRLPDREALPSQASREQGLL